MIVHDAAFRPLPAVADIRREDWRRIISEIKAGFLAIEKRALSNYKLGEMVGLDHSSIERLESIENADAKDYVGRLLRYWHRHYTGKIPISQQHGEKP